MKIFKFSEQIRPYIKIMKTNSDHGFMFSAQKYIGSHTYTLYIACRTKIFFKMGFSISHNDRKKIFCTDFLQLMVSDVFSRTVNCKIIILKTYKYHNNMFE